MGDVLNRGTRHKPKRNRKRPRGYGSVYQRGRLFSIKWKENGRTRYAHGYESRDFALDVLAIIVSNIKLGKAGLPEDKGPVPTLDELADKWLERREKTHRSWRDDKSRWTAHWSGFVGRNTPSQVDAATIRRFVERKLAAQLSPSTVRLCVRLLSTFYSDLVERKLVTTNPAKSLPRATRKLMRTPNGVGERPFIEKLDDVKRIFLGLKEPYNVVFAIGAFAGLRPGEVLALDWRRVDLGGRRIHVAEQVQEGELVPLKDDEGRIVPITSALLPVLTDWKLKTGGSGLLFRPKFGLRGGRPGRPPRFIRGHTLRHQLTDVLETLKLEREGLDWYSCTRHSYASHFVLAGGSIEHLSKLLGHSSTAVTERYSHLRADLFREEDVDRLHVDLRPGGAVVTMVPGDGGKVPLATIGLQSPISKRKAKPVYN